MATVNVDRVYFSRGAVWKLN